MLKHLPDRKLLHELLLLDAATGVLTWRPRPDSMFPAPKYAQTWNKKNAGREAGSNCGHGYRIVVILGQRYYAHRIVFWMLTGEPLAGRHVDHRFGDGLNNGAGRLRGAAPCENVANRQRVNSNNTSGVPGVWWHSTGKRWVADIKVNYKKIRIGMFTDLAEAADARREAELKYFGAFAPRHESKREVQDLLLAACKRKKK